MTHSVGVSGQVFWTRVRFEPRGINLADGFPYDPIVPPCRLRRPADRGRRLQQVPRIAHVTHGRGWHDRRELHLDRGQRRARRGLRGGVCPLRPELPERHRLGAGAAPAPAAERHRHPAQPGRAGVGAQPHDRGAGPAGRPYLPGQFPDEPGTFYIHLGHARDGLCRRQRRQHHWPGGAAAAGGRRPACVHRPAGEQVGRRPGRRGTRRARAGAQRQGGAAQPAQPLRRALPGPQLRARARRDAAHRRGHERTRERAGEQPTPSWWICCATRASWNPRASRATASTRAIAATRSWRNWPIPPPSTARIRRPRRIARSSACRRRTSGPRGWRATAPPARHPPTAHWCQRHSPRARERSRPPLGAHSAARRCRWVPVARFRRRRGLRQNPLRSDTR